MKQRQINFIFNAFKKFILKIGFHFYVYTGLFVDGCCVWYPYAMLFLNFGILVLFFRTLRGDCFWKKKNNVHKKSTLRPLIFVKPEILNLEIQVYLNDLFSIINNNS